MRLVRLEKRITLPAAAQADSGALILMTTGSVRGR